ncbi:MAG: hypothetical protein COB93_04485 [Sneathiella sp.]|nr:MAG: hypothetical protein COB93_04485 [Sneathiella sp.]
MALQVYTASLLKEGLVAYLCLEDGASSWTSDIRGATAGDGDLLETLKIAAEKAERDNLIIAPYVVDVLEAENGWKATTKREQIRADGPTIALPRDASAASTTDEGRKAA